MPRSDFTSSDIRNIFGVMNNIDLGDVDSDILPYMEWRRFADNPMRGFQRLGDAQQDAIAALINKRLARNGEDNG